MKIYVRAAETESPFIYDGTTKVPRDVTDVVVADGVTSIGHRAFDGCRSLTSITIPNSVTSIGGWAFDGCRSLTSITIPKSVTSIGDCAFMGCQSVTNIIIPNGVTSISVGTFEWCISLTSITNPDSVTSIGNFAFLGCESLKNITIPDSVTSIGKDVFEGCSNLKSLKCSDTVKALIYDKKGASVDKDKQTPWGTINSDEDFYEYMESFGQDVLEEITKKYPDIEIDYEQNGQGNHYTNDFFGTRSDGTSFSVSIPDSDVFDFSTYQDILEYGVNQVSSTIESDENLATL